MSTIIINKLDFERIQKCMAEAKQKKAINAVEAEKLSNELKKAKLVNPHKITSNIVTMNSVVRIRFGNNKEAEFKIVYPFQANIRENKISIFSPIATALIGYKIGDKIEWTIPSGKTTIEIIDILYQPEAAGDFDA